MVSSEYGVQHISHETSLSLRHFSTRQIPDARITPNVNSFTIGIPTATKQANNKTTERKSFWIVMQVNVYNINDVLIADWYVEAVVVKRQH